MEEHTTFNDAFFVEEWLYGEPSENLIDDLVDHEQECSGIIIKAQWRRIELRIRMVDEDFRWRQTGNFQWINFDRETANKIRDYANKLSKEEIGRLTIL